MVKELLQSIVKSVFSTKENLTSCEWVEKYCSLPAKTSNKKGQFSTKYNPFLRELFNILDNNKTKVVAIKKGTQLGLSLFSALSLTYIAAVKQQPALYFSINKDKVTEFASQKFYPILHECEQAAPFIPKNKDLLKKTRAELTSATLDFQSAQALSSFKSSSACYVYFDELDSSTDFKGEAPTDKLAGDRITSYGIDGKIFYFSSPSDSNSKINRLFLEGSQEYFEVPCKHCGHCQPLEFTQIKWDKSTEENPLTIDQRAESARYECRECQGLMYERDKLAVMDKGKWVQTNFKCPKDKRSFHISSLYSCDITWNQLAKEFMEAMESKDLDNLRHFRNSRLAEVYENIAVNNKFEDIDELIKRSPEYNRGQLIFEPEYMAMAIDKQRDVYYYVIEALDADFNRYVIDYGNVPDRDSLELIFNRIFKYQEKQFQVSWIWFDCGYMPDEVYDICLKNPDGIVAPCRGVKKESGAVDVGYGIVEYQGKKLRRYDLNDSIYSYRIIKNIIKDKIIGLYFPRNTEDYFKRQLIDEKIILKKVGNRTREEIKQGANNHYFDCVKYNEALFDEVLKGTNRN